MPLCTKSNRLQCHLQELMSQHWLLETEVLHWCFHQTHKWWFYQNNSHQRWNKKKQSGKKKKYKIQFLHPSLHSTVSTGTSRLKNSHPSLCPCVWVSPILLTPQHTGVPAHLLSWLPHLTSLCKRLSDTAFLYSREAGRSKTVFIKFFTESGSLSARFLENDYMGG